MHASAMTASPILSTSSLLHACCERLLLGRDSQLAKALNRLARTKVFQLEHLTHFDLAVFAAGFGKRLVHSMASCLDFALMIV